MKQTIIKTLHVDLETGIIHVLLHKRSLDESGNVLVQGNHRAVIAPDTDIDAMAKDHHEHFSSGQVQINGEVGTEPAACPDLTQWEKVKAHASIAHTPEIKAAWKARQEALLAEAVAHEKLAAEANAQAEAEAQAKFKAAVAEAVANLK